jgi:class 3 adenylate cyclase
MPEMPPCPSRGSQFCFSCGEPLKLRINHLPQPIGEPERKRITALFSDISRYTPMSDLLDPEEVKEITSSIFDGVRRIVKKYSGVIERFEGDGFLALFGTPRAHDDDPVRAIRAATEIHRFVEQDISPRYESLLGSTLSMHSGINTGLAVTADLDPEKGTNGVTGLSINIAARLCDLAAPSEILVGIGTQEVSKHHFMFKALGPTKIKGTTDRVPIFSLMSECLSKASDRDRRKVSFEMIGRNQELVNLEGRLGKLLDGEGSVVTIIGEAGIGKSRLMAELKKKAIIEKVTLLEGKAISIGKNLSFHPVIDLLKHWARIGEEDDERTAFRKLESAIRNVHPKDEAQVIAFVAVLMGMSLTGEYARRVHRIEGESLEKLILKNMRALLTRASQLSPLVVVAEDLHWADTSSVELLGSLFRLIETERILFVNVFRAAHRGAANRLVESVRKNFPEKYCEILLKPLDTETSERLIKGMLDLKGPHHPFVGQIVKRAEGNPFFIEEMVRSLIDEDAIIFRNGEFQITDRIKEVIVPQTINDVLRARIDRLDGKTRRLVKMAAVIGRTFFYRILAEIAEDLEDMDERLEYLKQTQLIRERNRMGETEYLFKHALAQEAAYESILRNKRKELHLRVAAAIESVFKRRLHEFYGMLAFHYSMGEDERKAAEYLTKAGEEALQASASSEAINYYQESLRLYQKGRGTKDDPTEVAQLEKKVALAFFNKGQHINALDYFDSSLARWGIKPSNNRLRRVFGFSWDFLSLLANLYVPSFRKRRNPDKFVNEVLDLQYKRSILLVYTDPKRSFAEFVKGQKILNRYDIREIEKGLALWMSSSLIFSWAGISHRISRRALEYAKDIVNPKDVKELLYFEFFDLLYHYFTGKWHLVKPYDDSLVDLNLKIGEFWLSSTYIVFHGFIRIAQGLFAEAETLIHRLFEIWTEYENKDAREYYCSLKIRRLLEMRSLKGLLGEIDTCIASQREDERKLAVSYYLGFKSLMQLQLEEVLEAADTLHQAEVLICEIGAVTPLYMSTSLMGRFAYDLKNLEQASSAKKPF